VSVIERETRLLASVYRTWGEAALWTSVTGGPALPVTVIRLTDEEVQDFGQGSAIVGTALFRVRPAEVSNPLEGDSLAIPDRAETFEVIGEPVRTRFGLEWLCQAKAA